MNLYIYIIIIYDIWWIFLSFMISVVKQLYPSTSPIAIWGPRWLPSRCQVMPAIPVWPPRTYDKKSDWRIRQVMTRLVNNPYIYIYIIYLSYIFHISIILCIYICIYIYIYISIYKAYGIRGVFIYRDTWFKTGKISRSRFGEKTMVDAFEERTGN